MLDELLEIIKEDVETFLKLKLRETREHLIQLAPIVDQDGKPSINENAICMSLIKIEEEQNNMSNGSQTKRKGNEIHHYNPPLRLNLYILFSASYIDGQEKNYIEALKRLSHILSFFQAKNFFNSQNTPRLDPAYGNISVSLYNQPFEEQSHLWGMLGNIYRPSVLYRFSYLWVQEEQVTVLSEPTRDADRTLTRKES